MSSIIETRLKSVQTISKWWLLQTVNVVIETSSATKTIVNINIVIPHLYRGISASNNPMAQFIHLIYKK